MTARVALLRHARRARAPKARRHREPVLSELPGSSMSGVGSKLAGEVGALTAVFCEILIVSRSTLTC